MSARDDVRLVAATSSALVALVEGLWATAPPADLRILKRTVRSLIVELEDLFPDEDR